MWERLLGFNFRLSQHNIGFWSIGGWIWGRFGLRFGRVLVACWRPKPSKTHVESKLMLKMRFAAEKSRFGADFAARRHESEAGVGRGSPSWGRVKIDYSLLESVLDRVGQALGWSAPVGACIANTPPRSAAQAQAAAAHSRGLRHSADPYRGVERSL